MTNIQGGRFKLQRLKKGIILPFKKNNEFSDVHISNIMVNDAVEEYYKVEIHDEYEGIIHELNNYISIIHGETQLAETFVQNDPTNPLNKSIDSIKQNCLKLTKTADKFITLKKIQDRQYGLLLKEQNIVEVIEDVVINVSKVIKNKNIIFDTNIEEKYMLCDLEKIRKSILIFLCSAVKFSDENEILVNLNIENNDIDIAIAFASKDDNCLNILIDKMDNLNMKNSEDISMEFHICKSIINLHKGTVNVEGNKNKIQFSINLPCDNTDDIYYLNRDKLYNNENYIEQINVEFSDVFA